MLGFWVAQSVKHLPSAQVVIPGSWDRALLSGSLLKWGACLPFSLCLRLCLCVSLMNK